MDINLELNKLINHKKIEVVLREKKIKVKYLLIMNNSIHFNNSIDSNLSLN
jgi:hypothetical protein